MIPTATSSRTSKKALASRTRSHLSSPGTTPIIGLSIGVVRPNSFVSRPLKYQSTPPAASASMTTLIDEK